MTSSLVGSEMCIRDSSWGEKRIKQFGIAGIHPSAISENNILTDSGWTVSYTHLTLPTICSV
eukprot:5828751-Prorocentrum_lima.AAC.1